MKASKLLLFTTSLLVLASCDFANKKECNHIDKNFDHICDRCKEQISDHLDEDKDHYCDVCALKLSEHEDLNENHFCDYCREKLSDHVDNNHDNICDFCHQQFGVDPTIIDAPVPTKLDYRSGYDFSTEVDKPTSGTTTINLYGFNDFHGAVNINATLLNFGTYIRNITENDNTLVIDSGDTWQGSLESNYNKGNLITDVMAYARVSARTIGNHDFDWGTYALQENTSRYYRGYTVPTLGANIYNFDWNSKTIGDVQMYNLGREYAIYTLENGLKVGIIGVIGADQITSIATNFVKGITFTDHVEKLKEVSDYLRVTEGCDLIIGSEHDQYVRNEDNDLTEVSPVSHKKYCDFVFNGHSHTQEDYCVNGVPFVQCGRNGEMIGHAQITYDYALKSIVSGSYTYEKISYKQISSAVSKTGVDPVIKGLVESYAQVTDELGTKVLTDKLVGYFDKTEYAVNLMCEAIYFECKKQKIDVDFTFANDARTYLSSALGKDFTYSSLYQAFPFDNTVYIIDMSGRTGCKELANYNCVYNTGIYELSISQTYRVAAIDYLAFHTDANRNYDYFPNAKEITYLTRDDGTVYTYRDILADYLLDNPNKVFDAEDYSSNESRFTHPTIQTAR